MKALQCNDIFLQKFGFIEIPLGRDIYSICKIEFLESGLKEFTDNNVFYKKFIYSHSVQNVQFDYEGLMLGNSQYSVLFFNELLLDAISMIKIMTELNMETVTMTRELSKKNLELKRANEKISILMDTDYLTGIKNRRYFYYRLDAMLANSRRDDDFIFCVTVFDLDKFKTINDHFGHAAGDKALIEVTSAIRKQLRKEDEYARTGGEEFAIALLNQKLANAAAKVENLRKVVENIILDNIPNITASFGVTEMIHTDDVNSIMNRADKALYMAKESGRNNVVTI